MLARRAFRIVTKAAASHKSVSVEQSLRALEKRPNHEVYARHLKNDNIPLVIGIGPAGCGKTLLACAHAITRLSQKEISKVVITRPAVAMDEEHGFLPGDLESKMMPWLIPIYDCFKEYVTIHRLREYINNEEIEICPLSYIRGRTFHNCWVIADEVQNSTVNQMKTLLTRLGQNSKMVLTGDLQQCDLKVPSGLEDFMRRYNYMKHDATGDEPRLIEVVNFTDDDIMRSELVKHVLKVYEY